MYNVVIVEDDQDARQGLERNIPWAELDLDVVATAGTAEEVLGTPAHYRADLYLIDIRLPGMDGIELLSAIRGQDERARIILVTAYKDFSYAQRAIPLDVTDFVLKPIEHNQLYASLGKACDELSNLDENRSEQMEARRILHQELTRRVLNGTIRFGDISHSEVLSRVSTGSSVAMAGLVHLDSERSLSLGKLAYDLSQKVRPSLSPEDTCLVADTGRVELGLILSSTDRVNGDIHSKAKAVAQEIVSLLRDDHAVTATVAVGDPVGYIQDVPRSFRHARSALGYRDRLGSGRVIDAADVAALFEDSSSRISAAVYDVLELLLHGQEAELEEKGRLIADSESSIRADLLRAKLAELLGGVEVLLRELDLQAANATFSTGAAHYFWRVTDDSASIPDLLRSLHSVLTRIQRSVASAVENDSQLLVKRAMLIVLKDYSERNLSLSSVARRVGSSESYLSSIFKRHSGTKFTSYVRQVRIAKAQDLLINSRLPIYEVAEKVGYENAHYFATCFHREVGATPSEVRSGR